MFQYVLDFKVYIHSFYVSVNEKLEELLKFEADCVTSLMHKFQRQRRENKREHLEKNDSVTRPDVL